jgi:hypothetical protein
MWRKMAEEPVLHDSRALQSKALPPGAAVAVPVEEIIERPSS